eukprot:CAMPEP_0194423794 /NCGR_PEP_ID=MMETSP0176-20130528/23057_1 /TAXON_ID=216777 /ORGANISM="Proboscia alata, Strain PI-D3" /LENGTH=130 /DNA_ID=CAMNT_0039233199 /DNA_START=1 /DNA_END=390 /DNA_ORIENTATION=-
MNDYTAPILADLCRSALQTVVFGDIQPQSQDDNTHSLLGSSLSVSTEETTGPCVTSNGSHISLGLGLCNEILETVTQCQFWVSSSDRDIEPKPDGTSEETPDPSHSSLDSNTDTPQHHSSQVNDTIASFL